jgi:hypothetical protein
MFFSNMPQGGVDAMLIWVIGVLIPVGLLSSVVVATKGGARRRG